MMPRYTTHARRHGRTATTGFSVVGVNALSNGRRIVDTASIGSGESANDSPWRSASETGFAGRSDDALLDLLDDYA